MTIDSRGLRGAKAALLVLLALGQGVAAQSTPAAGGASDAGAAAVASAPSQFPDLPLRRDPPASAPVVESLGWALLLLAAIAGAGAGFVAVRRKMLPNFRLRTGGWLPQDRAPSTPKLLGRTLLTQQASVHSVEWRGEELLLGCTSQAVTVLARRPAAAAQSPVSDEEGKASQDELRQRT